MIRAADVSPFTPIETKNSCTSLPALYLYPITSLYGGKEIAEIDASLEALDGSRACIHKNYEMTCLTTALLVATYVLSAGILPALAALLTLAIRSNNKFHYVEPTQALNNAGETVPRPQRSATPSAQAVQGTANMELNEKTSPKISQFLTELVPAYIADATSEVHDGLAVARMEAIMTKLNGAQPFEENGQLSEVLDEAIIEEFMASGTLSDLQNCALSPVDLSATLIPHLDSAIRRKWLASTPVSSEELDRMPSGLRAHCRTHSQLEEIQQEETLYLESRKAQKLSQPQALQGAGDSALNDGDQEMTSPQIAQNLMELVIDYMTDAQHEVQDGLADARMQAIMAKLNGAEPFEGDNWHFSEALSEAIVEQFMATSDLQQLQNLRGNWEEMNYAPDQRDVLLPHLDAAIRRKWLASTPVSSEELERGPSLLKVYRRTHSQLEQIQQEETLYLESRKAQKLPQPQAMQGAESNALNDANQTTTSPQPSEALAEGGTFHDTWNGLMALSLLELQNLRGSVVQAEVGSNPQEVDIGMNSSFAPPPVEPVTQIHDLGPKPFDTIELRGAGNLHITRGESNSLTITADEDLLDDISPSCLPHKLTMGASDQVRNGIEYNLTVTSDPRILYHHGSGKVTIDSLDADTFTCHIIENGEVVIESGKLSAQIVKISKSGMYNASNLKAEASVLTIEGSGRAEVRTLTHLTAQAPESSQCKEHGWPIAQTCTWGAKSGAVSSSFSMPASLTWGG